MHFRCRFAIIIKHRATRAVRAGQQMNMGAFPSGQWGQTVNLLLNASVVRIHQLPPKGCDKNVVTAFFLCYIAENRHLRRPIFKARFTVLSNRFRAVVLFCLRHREAAYSARQDRERQLLPADAGGHRKRNQVARSVARMFGADCGGLAADQLWARQAEGFEITCSASDSLCIIDSRVWSTASLYGFTK